MVGKRGRSWEKGRKKERKTRRKRAGGGRDVWRFRVMRFNYKTRRVLQLAGRRARHPLPLSPFSPFSTRYLLRFDRLISPPSISCTTGEKEEDRNLSRFLLPANFRREREGRFKYNAIIPRARKRMTESRMIHQSRAVSAELIRVGRYTVSRDSPTFPLRR